MGPLRQVVEGVGLWVLKRWGEYVAVVGTTLFIPLEIYELTDQISWLKIVALAINTVASRWRYAMEKLRAALGARV